MKRVIEKLDELGVAVLSISGGGEPLLRDDFDELIDYASDRGLYVKLTSNGTMPRAKYQRLLGSAVDEIGISLDGVSGHDLPFSHVGAPILNTLRFLNDYLPVGKRLTINVTVSQANRDQVQEIVDYCAEHYPKARVWLNPVVVGDGALRTSAESRCYPDYLRSASAPTLLKAEFYTRGAEEQFQSNWFDWNCKAGDVFFDIKPNGDYWLCQDQPSPVPLNVLDPDFELRRRSLDKGRRRLCAGCVYSCYYLVQKSMEPRNWRDTALLWWHANTEPDGPERNAANRCGAAGAIAFLLWKSVRSSLPAAARTAALLLLGVQLALAQAIDPETVLSRMETRNASQLGELREWVNERVYRAGNEHIKRSATARVRVRFVPPGTKDWSVIDAEGSTFILKGVIRPLLEAEQEGARPAVRAATDITRANYSFRFLRWEQAEHVYLFEAIPKHPGKYNFQGLVAVDDQSFAVRYVKGKPARRPSFWVRSTEFQHEYASFHGLWLPARHRSVTDLRIIGRSTLEIDYLDYAVSTSSAAEAVRPRKEP